MAFSEATSVIVFVLFWDRISFYSPDWPGAQDPAPSASQVLGLQVHTSLHWAGNSFSRTLELNYSVCGPKCHSFVYLVFLSVQYFKYASWWQLSSVHCQCLILPNVPRWTDQLVGTGSWATEASSDDGASDWPWLPTTKCHCGSLRHTYWHQWQQAVFPTMSPWKGISYQGLWSSISMNSECSFSVICLAHHLVVKDVNSSNPSWLQTLGTMHALKKNNDTGCVCCFEIAPHVW